MSLGFYSYAWVLILVLAIDSDLGVAEVVDVLDELASLYLILFYDINIIP